MEIIGNKNKEVDYISAVFEWNFGKMLVKKPLLHIL